MPEAIAYEERERAKELYIFEGLTLEQVSKETGISAGSLERWSSEEGWFQERKEYRAALQAIKRKTVALNRALLEKACSTLDPQVVYAAARVGQIALQGQKKNEKPAAEIDRPALFLKDLEFVAEVLGEIDPEGLKVLGRSFETIVQRFKEQHAQAA